MATKYHKHFSTKVTPQSEPIPGTTQVKNNAGGFAWAVDRWTRLDRFLILGCEGGTYYQSEQQLTKENGQNILECLHEDLQRTVNRILEISEGGRASKNDPALFALAVAASVDSRSLVVLPRVARTGTHLFTFVEYAEMFRGWGRSMRDAVGKWYNDKDPDKLAYQLVKYRQRGGWSHRDLLRLSHPKPRTPEHNTLFGFAVSDQVEVGAKLPKVLDGFELVRGQTDSRQVVKILEDFPGISWEMIPTECLKDPNVWQKLIENRMPMTALFRNLGRMTANGALAPLSPETEMVCQQLTNPEMIEMARIHPIQVLAALTTYRQGHGSKGNLNWTPVVDIVDALEDAFYLAFDNIEPTGKRYMLALDVSGSMSVGEVGGIPGLSPRAAAAAMLMVTLRSEKAVVVKAFAQNLVDLVISRRDSLTDVVKKTGGLKFGRTDCAQPMIAAIRENLPIDVFVVYTDNETWAGYTHPVQALQEYRRKTGINAKLAVVGMTSGGFSIADPNDLGMMDFVGFDTSTPNALSQFAILGDKD